MNGFVLTLWEGSTSPSNPAQSQPRPAQIPHSDFDPTRSFLSPSQSPFRHPKSAPVGWSSLLGMAQSRMGLRIPLKWSPVLGRGCGSGETCWALGMQNQPCQKSFPSSSTTDPVLTQLLTLFYTEFIGLFSSCHTVAIHSCKNLVFILFAKLKIRGGNEIIETLHR